MTETNDQQFAPDEIPTASEVPAAEGSRSAVAVKAAIAAEEEEEGVGALETAATRSAIPSGRSVWFRSAGFRRPSRAARR